MSRSKRSDRAIWIILALALGVRLLAAFQWQSLADREENLFRFGDSESYWILANRISHGEDYFYGGKDSMVFRAPVYPLVLSPITWFASDRTAVLSARCLGAILGVFAVFLVMKSAEQLGGKGASYGAGLLAAAYPGAIGMSIFVLSEASFCPLVLLSLFLWDRGQRLREQGGSNSKAIWMTGWSGLLTGVAALARPSWILWPACLFLLCMMPPREKNLKSLAIFVIGMVLAMSPWWYRNYRVTGEFVPTTLQVGASLYDGWHPGATGASDEGMHFSEEFASTLRQADKAAEARGETQTRSFEYRLDRQLFSAALQWAKENPSDVVRLALIKCWKTWSPFPTAKQVGGFGLRAAEATYYLVIVGFGLLGFWKVRDQLGIAALYLLPCLYYGALHTVFVGSIRYRQPPILILAVLAGVGLAAAWGRIQRSDQLPLKN